MKKFGLTLVMAMMAVMLVAGGAWAISLSAEYGLISPEPIIGMPDYDVGVDLGYYIWTDTEVRNNWHIRWTGAGPDTQFDGKIILDGNSFDEFKEISFESHTGSIADWSYNTSDSANYFAIANVGEDGLDFSLIQTSVPSYVGFDLFINSSQVIGEKIFFGADNITAASLGEDGDFKVAAPVPEPGTMALLGIGLLGLAFVGRRKLKIKE